MPLKLVLKQIYFHPAFLYVNAFAMQMFCFDTRYMAIGPLAFYVTKAAHVFLNLSKYYPCSHCGIFSREPTSKF